MRSCTDSVARRLPLLAPRNLVSLANGKYFDALISGLVWVSVGVIYAVVLTKVTGKRLNDVGMDESAATEVEEAFATEPRTAPRVLVGV